MMHACFDRTSSFCRNRFLVELFMLAMWRLISGHGALALVLGLPVESSLAVFCFAFTSLRLQRRASTRMRNSPTMEGAGSTSARYVDRGPLPNVPDLPPPILSLTPGTWAHDTMSRRVDKEILERTFNENKHIWEADPRWIPVIRRFNELRMELQSASATKLTHLDPLPALSADESGESQQQQLEHEQWYDLLGPFVEAGDTWLSAPWMVTEFYVYRRLMQVLDYWNPESIGYLYDPFDSSKEAGLKSSVASADALLRRFPTLLAGAHPENEGLLVAISAALWGNKMDLSLWPADLNQSNTDVFSAVLEAATENLLHNDEHKVSSLCARLRERGGGNVHVIVDNAGFELITDLALAQFLIESGIAATVTFELKSHPTFVSDALAKDLRRHVSFYTNEVDPTHYPSCTKAGCQWQRYLDEGRWICHEDSFWVQPYAMWEMPSSLRQRLASSCDLAFVKGDANYRRLLGDRQWDFTTPFQDVVGSYFPCPVCALRTLKAELGCGMEAEQVARAQRIDSKWLVNGRFGVVHFGTGIGHEVND
jgi:Damage-control phosphatase ARMT1-like domain